MTLDLAVVTSCAGYGQYLADWADSLLAQTRRPTRVVIVTHGRPGDGRLAAVAAARLREVGLDVVTEHHPQLLDFGAARNRAVELAGDVTWVMHLDADDMLMPHALVDVAALAGGADVVALGYERCGDLASGPRNLTKVYKSSQGQSTLDSTAPASGVSPFRRTFWERSPYRTDLVGGWDTALWLGFAHLGARFVPTIRPCFLYRQHGDSIFNVRRKSGWQAARAGAKLQSLRENRWAGVTLLVPVASDNGGARDRAWAWLRRRLVALYPDWQLVEGRGQADSWRKGDAIRDGLTRATGATLVILDSDCVLPPDALPQAVQLVASGKAPWVVPHTLVHRLTEQATAPILAQDPTLPLDATIVAVHRPPYLGFPGGGALVVPRVEFEATGGIPRDFVGWGAEDETLAVILDTLLGPHQRLADDLVHLWHPPAEGRVSTVRRSGSYAQNRQIFRRFLAMKGNVEGLWQLCVGAQPAGGTYYSPRGLVLDRAARHAQARTEVQAMTRDSFAERNLTRAAQPQTTNPGDFMAGALAVKHGHALIRKQQAIRNQEALDAELARQQRAGLLPTPNKALLNPPPAKSPAAQGHSGVTITQTPAIKWASVQAEQLAQERGLTAEQVAAIPQVTSRGITLAQVRALP